MGGLSATRTKPARGLALRGSGAAKPRRSLLLLLVLVLDDLGLAHEHRAALELVERLHQLEVLVASQLGHLAVGDRLARFFLGLLDGELAQLLARGVLDL